MEEFRPPRGLIAELVTPFDQQGHIHIQGLVRHLKALEGYVHAVFLASPRMGEGLTLPAHYRKQLLQGIRETGNPGYSIFIWVTGKTERETAQIIEILERERESLGNTGNIFWVDSPLFYHSNRGLPELYSRFSSISQTPFILMNDPGLVGKVKRPLKRRNIRTSIFKELALFPKITGMIFLGPLDRAYNYQKAARGRAHFRIYDGDETRFLDYPSLSGVVSIGANLAPEHWRLVCDSSLHLANDHKTYPDSLKQMWETGQFLIQLQDAYSISPSILIRQLLYEKGIFKYPPPDFPDDLRPNKEKIQELLAAFEPNCSSSH